VPLDLSNLSIPSERAMQWLVVGAAYFLVLLFAIGLFDLLLSLWRLLTSGQFTDPVAVIGLIDTVLLLLIIVEVHRTLLAYAREQPVTQIVINVAIIAVARKVISFRIEEFESADAAFTGAVAFATLLAVLLVAAVVIRRFGFDVGGTEPVGGESAAGDGEPKAQ